ncbi:UNKNOWN [Stylonychia lemnae]|uniref:Amino acid transporter transmembrane domain-containing protein n=1 Tax=Stylonychia lemnae TaxID=5949 RepID=A0A078AUE3_STYLE|nr:UNKNOWN [Stylonychia lemnae]|eukprot:CDW85844.1 UNKNOWN [Stylonychia lemnae]
MIPLDFEMQQNSQIDLHENLINQQSYNQRNVTNDQSYSVGINVTSRNYSMNRSLSQRMFSKIDHGSLRGSTFQLMTSAIGTGFLSLSFVFSQTGFVQGTIMLMIGGFAGYLSLFMLAECFHQSEQSRSYPGMVRRIGGRCLNKIAFTMIVLQMTGSNTSYIINMTNAIQSIFLQFNYDIAFTKTSAFKFETGIAFAFILLFIQIFSTKMSAFRHASLITVLVMAYITFVIAQNYSYQKLKFFQIDWKTPENFAIIFFSFSCHIEHIPIMDELKFRSMPRINKVIFRSVSLNSLCYLTIALAGYFSTYDKTDDVIFKRKALYETIDYPMLLGQILMPIVLKHCSFLMLYYNYYFLSYYLSRHYRGTIDSGNLLFEIEQR